MCEVKSWETIEDPWAEKFVKESTDFVLEEDKDAVRNYNDKNPENQIHLEYPPQPFQGSPEAKIWLLALNPGWAELDSSFYSDCNNRNAILKQLAFDEPDDQCYWHYVMNPKYTCKNSYSRQWFEKYIFKPFCRDFLQDEKKYDDNVKIKILDKTLFILQLSGYASANVSNKTLKALGITEQKNKHIEFVKTLLQWGVDNKKKFIISRPEAVWEQLFGEENIGTLKKGNRLFVTSSKRALYFSKNNLLLWQDRNLKGSERQNAKKNVNLF